MKLGLNASTMTKQLRGWAVGVDVMGGQLQVPLSFRGEEDVFIVFRTFQISVAREVMDENHSGKSVKRIDERVRETNPGTLDLQARSHSPRAAARCFVATLPCDFRSSGERTSRYILVPGEANVTCHTGLTPFTEKKPPLCSSLQRTYLA